MPMAPLCTWLCAFVRETELVELSCTSWSSKFSMLDLSVSVPHTSLHLNSVLSQVRWEEPKLAYRVT